MKKQAGFTLVEIAIVLIVIGLLLGGMLNGQELINSARVRSLSNTATGVQTAYYGFIDRYRRVPGDWNATGASQAIGSTIVDGGNNNGWLDNPSGANLWKEANALWSQLAAAGFIRGDYAGGVGAPNSDNGVAPLNAFSNVMLVARSGDFLGAPGSRLHLVLGRGVPAEVMRELDLKIDDGFPATGNLRGTVSASALFGPPGEQEAICVDSTVTPNTWNIRAGSRNCNAVYLF